MKNSATICYFVSEALTAALKQIPAVYLSLNELAMKLANVKACTCDYKITSVEEAFIVVQHYTNSA